MCKSKLTRFASRTACHLREPILNHLAIFPAVLHNRYGQPPPAIIKEIAPGLELDEEGVPKLDGMGGLPFGENEECSIM